MPPRGVPGGVAARPRRSSPVVIALVAGVVVVGVAVIGVLAAIAVPRFATAVEQAKAQEATSALQRVHARQEAYRDENGRYTADLAVLPGAPVQLGFHSLEVSVASADRLCVEAHPLPGMGEGLSIVSIDESGWIHAGPGCDEAIQGEEEILSDSSAAP